MRVTVDPNERWLDPQQAGLRLAQLEALGNVQCVEDPIPRTMLEEYRGLRHPGGIAIALHIALPLRSAGHRISDAIDAICARAVDAFNLTAGPAAFRRLANVATAADLPFWVGSQIDLGILEALYLHMAMATPGTLWPSDIFGRLIRTHDLLETPLPIEPPVARVPDGPGLGVVLDREALDRHATRKEEFKAA